MSGYNNSIVIDVNGDKKPNQIGRDIFSFVLGNNGMLYPVGSDASVLVKYPPAAVSSFSWKNNCNASKKTSVCGGINGNFTGTGRIFENGFKMDY